MLGCLRPALVLGSGVGVLAKNIMVIWEAGFLPQLAIVRSQLPGRSVPGCVFSPKVLYLSLAHAFEIIPFSVVFPGVLAAEP